MQTLAFMVLLGLVSSWLLSLEGRSTLPKEERLTGYERCAQNFELSSLFVSSGCMSGSEHYRKKDIIDGRLLDLAAAEAAASAQIEAYVAPPPAPEPPPESVSYPSP